MKLKVGCLSCVLCHAVRLTEHPSFQPQERERYAEAILKEAAKLDWNATPPEYAGRLHKALHRISGTADLFRTEKDHSTQLALRLLPHCRELINALPPAAQFGAIVKLVIGGNIIDYGADANFSLDTVQAAMAAVPHMPLEQTAIDELEAAMSAAHTVFYLLDNCGEAVFDQLLIERFADKITLGVRGRPILNDITPRELADSGLGAYPFVDTGDAIPGVSLTDSAPAFLAAMRAADLVVAKGQGNFESLGEYDRPIFYLLRIKCPVIAAETGVPFGSLCLKHRNLPTGRETAS